MSQNLAINATAHVVIFKKVTIGKCDSEPPSNWENPWFQLFFFLFTNFVKTHLKKEKFGNFENSGVRSGQGVALL